MPTVELTAKRARESRSDGTDTVLFDRSLPGFGLRIHPSGNKVYILQTRIEGRTRRLLVDRYADMGLAQARRRARDLLACVRAGENPAEQRRRARRMPRFEAFAAEYLRRCGPHFKPSGRRTVRMYLKARLVPAFGKMPLDRIGPEDVAAWFDEASRTRPGAANRALDILRAMLFRAERWGWRERGTNPCLGIRRNASKPIARFLDAADLTRLGRALENHRERWPDAIAAIRLLALTGCRRSEVLDLRWGDIGPRAIRLPDSKTGPRTVPLAAPARAVLDSLPGPRGADVNLFPRFAGVTNPHSLILCWRTVREQAGLGSVRLHDLRHILASQAVMSGENLPLVGQLLGHRRHATTARYAHLADDHLLAAAEHVGTLIAEAMALTDR